jgi:hypothetical protein
MAKGNVKNLRPRTQEGLQAALVASVPLAAGIAAHDGAAIIRKAMMKHGYMAKVTLEAGKVIATSGDLRAEVSV